MVKSWDKRERGRSDLPKKGVLNKWVSCVSGFKLGLFTDDEGLEKERQNF